MSPSHQTFVIKQDEDLIQTPGSLPKCKTAVWLPARPLRLDTTGGVATTIQRSRGWGIACPTSKNYM